MEIYCSDDNCDSDSNSDQPGCYQLHGVLKAKRLTEMVSPYSYGMNNPYTMPCAIMALATFMKPAMLAPLT